VAMSDKLIAEIRTQVAGVSQSMSSMRSLLAGMQNTGNIGISMPADLAINYASLKKTFGEMNNLISTSGKKSAQLISGVSGKTKEISGNFTGLNKTFEGVKVPNLKSLPEKKETIKNNISQISTCVREKVSLASSSAREKITDKITNFKEPKTSALSNFPPKISERIALSSGSNDGINIGEIISQLKPNDILNHLKAIESAIRGTRQHEKKVNA